MKKWGVLLGVVCAILGGMGGAARAWDQDSSLTILNLTSVDIVSTAVSGTDNSDWNSQQRPDNNFQKKTIAAGASATEPADMNSWSRSSWFTMQLSFRNGDSITFRNDQRDALGSQYRPYGLQAGDSAKYALIQVASGGRNTFVVTRNIPTASWTSALPDATPVQSLTIPGTHDTSTWNTSLPPAKTQTRSFGQQLADGIRFFDIRVRRVTGSNGAPAWAVHHANIYLDLNFNDVLTAIQRFMAANPRETVIVSIKEDDGAMPGVTASMSQTFKAYAQQVPAVSWYTETAYPTLGQVRGKVILLRRYGLDANEQPYGWDGSNWADNATFTISNPPLSINVQDVYKAGGGDKIHAVQQQLIAARSNPSPQALFINFTSSNTTSCAYTPIVCAAGIMPAVRLMPVMQGSRARYGIIPLDFYEVYAPFVSVLIANNAFP